MGIFDWKHWIVLLVVVVLVFGTKKLKNLGGDLGESIKGFRKAMNDEETKPAEQTPPPAQPIPPVHTTQPHAAAPQQPQPQPQGHTIEGQAQPVQEPQRKD
ncbi:twin-arginine translocase TatA/TatE family subunit [Pseudomonas sp. P39-UII1]|uniref:twin-arginine translocase TatA/TatE family subunit n=1 Tax=unclassified Pseudomonas TaxID=196821 RepID=UPI003208E8B2